MKKVLCSLMSLSIISSTVSTATSCGNTSNTLIKVKDNQLNYLMEQYSKAVYLGSKNDVNVNTIFESYIMNENTSILNTTLQYKPDSFRYDSLFTNYFNASNYLSNSIKLTGISNVQPEHSPETMMDSLEKIFSMVQSSMSLVSTQDVLSVLIKIITESNILEYVSKNMYELINYGSVLFSQKYVDILKDALSINKYIQNNMTYQEALESSVISLSNAMKILKTGNLDNLTEEYDKKNMETNYVKSIDSFVTNLDLTNQKLFTWNNKITVVSKFIKFITQLLFYLNHFYNNQTTPVDLKKIQNERQMQIPEIDEQKNDFIDFTKLFKVVKNILDQKAKTDDRVNSLMTLLAPLLMYRDDDLKLSCTFKLSPMGVTIDVKKSNIDFESNDAPNSGLSYFVLKLLNWYLKDMNLFNLGDQISFENGELSMAAVLLRVINCATSNKKIDFGGFIINRIIKGAIAKLIQDKNLLKIIQDGFKSLSLSLLDALDFLLIGDESKGDNTLYNFVSEIANTPNLKLDFNALSHILDILSNLKYLKNGQYKEFLEAIGYVNNKIVEGSPLSYLKQLLNEFSGFSTLLQSLMKYLSSIFDKQKQIMINISKELQALKPNTATLVSKDKRNNYQFAYDYDDKKIKINVSQEKNRLYISKISVD